MPGMTQKMLLRFQTCQCPTLKDSGSDLDQGNHPQTPFVLLGQGSERICISFPGGDFLGSFCVFSFFFKNHYFSEMKMGPNPLQPSLCQVVTAVKGPSFPLPTGPTQPPELVSCPLP